MQTVIILGGFGTRIRSIEKNMPKSMIDVNGKPFLYHLLAYLNSNGINNFLLLTGYKSEAIKKFFKNGKELGYRINYSIEKKPLGTGGAVINAYNLLSENFILLNGDTYYFFDLKKNDKKIS